MERIDKQTGPLSTQKMVRTIEFVRRRPPQKGAFGKAQKRIKPPHSPNTYTKTNN